MKINNPIFDNIKMALTLYQSLMDIQQTPPTAEQSDELMIGLAQLGLSQRMIEEGSLDAVKAQLMHLFNELLHENFELSLMDPLIPKSVEPVLNEIADHIESADHYNDQYFGEEGIRQDELVTLFSPIEGDTLIESEGYPRLRELREWLVEKLIAKLSEYVITQRVFDEIKYLVKDIEMVEYVLQFFNLVDYEEVTVMQATHKEISAGLNIAFNDVIEGLEDYGRHFELKASQSSVAGMEANFLDNLKSGLKNFIDTIVAAFKKIKDFFAGQLRDSGDKNAKLSAEFTKKIAELKTLKDDDYEVDPDGVKRTIEMLEKAGYPEAASSFKSANTLSGVISAYQSAASWLDSNALDSKDAQSAVDDGQKAVDNIAGFSPSLTDDAGKEEKSAVSEENKTLRTQATEAVNTAKEKTTAFFKGLSVKDRLVSTMAKCFKRKSAAAVAGTEAWEL